MLKTFKYLFESESKRFNLEYYVWLWAPQNRRAVAAILEVVQQRKGHQDGQGAGDHGTPGEAEGAGLLLPAGGKEE